MLSKVFPMVSKDSRVVPFMQTHNLSDKIIKPKHGHIDMHIFALVLTFLKMSRTSKQ